MNISKLNANTFNELLSNFNKQEAIKNNEHNYRLLEISERFKIYVNSLQGDHK